MQKRSVSRRDFFGASVMGWQRRAGRSWPSGRSGGGGEGATCRPHHQGSESIRIERGRIASVSPTAASRALYAATRYFHPNWSNEGWLDYAKRVLVGKSALIFRRSPRSGSREAPPGRVLTHPPSTTACGHTRPSCGLPVFRILGAYRDKVLAYASSQHLKTADAFVEDVLRCKAEGFKAYRSIHPGCDGGVDSDWT